jgi:hypothetical protein
MSAIALSSPSYCATFAADTLIKHMLDVFDDGLIRAERPGRITACRRQLPKELD